MKKLCLLLTTLICLVGLPAHSCHLPAHPSGAAIPVKGTPGMILVEESSTFYYLVAEGTLPE